MSDSFSTATQPQERHEARRRAQAARRVQKAAGDAEWAEHLHVDPHEYAAEVAQLNDDWRSRRNGGDPTEAAEVAMSRADLNQLMRQYRAIRARYTAHLLARSRRVRIACRPARHRPAGRRRRAACSRSCARSGASSEEGPADPPAPPSEEAGR